MKRTLPIPSLVVSVALLGNAVLGDQASTNVPSKRQGEILDGITRYAPSDCPERWLHELGNPAERNRAILRRMLSAASWVEFLALSNALDWSKEERAATHDFLLKVLQDLQSGKVRQNIIFLLALTAPEARETLGRLLDGRGGTLMEADMVDLRCALAALGDLKAIEWFIQEFKGTKAFIGRPLFNFGDYLKEELQETNRGTVRSYRFWEVLFRQPYFKKLKLLSRSGIYQMQARDMQGSNRDLLAARLLPAFIAKWPGHPGCDDSALRLMNHAIDRRDLKDIYRWAQQASLLPDQDCHKTAVGILGVLADSQLSILELEEILASDDRKQNMEFLHYERFLKIARESVAAGIKFFDSAALADPSGLFARARRQAAAIEPSQALRDGRHEGLTREVIRLYPVRSRSLAETPHQPAEVSSDDEYLNVLTGPEKELVRRTRLERRDSIAIDSGKLAWQYRMLVELNNLLVLENQETDPDSKADLRYRRAKVFYREGMLLCPIWAEETLSWGYALNAVRFDADADRRLERFVAQTFGLRRAYDILASILADYPGYSSKHNVLFHMAQSYAKLMDYKPAKAVDVWAFSDRPPPGSREGTLEFGHRRAGELFRRVADEFPDSEWADEAKKGASYRFKMANLLRVRREKAERLKVAQGKSREF